MKVAICDFDKKYVENLFTYLLGKCNGIDFFTFTTVEDYEVRIMNEKDFSYVIISDEFYELKEAYEKENCVNNCLNTRYIVLNTTLEKFEYEGSYQTIYKFGPMDGLWRLINNNLNNTREESYSNLHRKSTAIFSPMHHELTEAYAFCYAQNLSENGRVLMVNMMTRPLFKKVGDDEEVGSIVDFVFDLEARSNKDIEVELSNYKGIDLFPVAYNPLDIMTITKEEWEHVISYIDSMNYDRVVFLIDDINQGFKEIMSYVDECLVINKRGDFFKCVQQELTEVVRNLCNKVTVIELLMSAKNLTEGCYQIEELLSGNLGKYVRSQGI